MPSKNVVVIIIISVILLLSILFLIIDKGSLGCENTDYFDDGLKKCYYSISKNEDTGGKTVTGLNDCRDDENYSLNKCYYDKKGKLGKGIPAFAKWIFWLSIIALAVFLVYVIVSGRKGEPNKKVNQKAGEQHKLRWARKWNMEIINDKPTGNFYERNIRPDESQNMKARIVEWEVTGCNNPRGNGLFTVKYSLFDNKDVILNGEPQFSVDEIPYTGWEQERRKYSFTAPQDKMDEVIDLMLESDNEKLQTAAFSQAVKKEG